MGVVFLRLTSDFRTIAVFIDFFLKKTVRKSEVYFIFKNIFLFKKNYYICISLTHKKTL